MGNATSLMQRLEKDHLAPGPKPGSERCFRPFCVAATWTHHRRQGQWEPGLRQARGGGLTRFTRKRRWTLQDQDLLTAVREHQPWLITCGRRRGWQGRGAFATQHTCPGVGNGFACSCIVGSSSADVALSTRAGTHPCWNSLPGNLNSVGSSSLDHLCIDTHGTPSYKHAWFNSHH